MHKKAYARIFGGSLKIRDNFTIAGQADVVKLKSLETFRNGKIMPTEYVWSGDIAVLSNVQNLRIGDVIGVRSKNLPQVSLAHPSLQASDAVIHMQDPSNPYCASVGLSIEPLPLGS